MRQPVVYVCGTQDWVDLHAAAPDRLRLRIASSGRVGGGGADRKGPGCGKDVVSC